MYIDTVGDPERYAQKLSQRFPTLSFTVCPKVSLRVSDASTDQLE